jgi:type IV fimbrial biogenesis protein FimT
MSGRHQGGLSLIELMVGITIAALLLTLAIPQFRTGMQNRQIRSAAEALQNGLQLARTEALRRNRTVQFQLGTGNSWTVGCNPSDPTLDNGVPICPDTIQARPTPDSTANAQVDTQQLTSAGAPAASPVFTNTVKFTPLGRTTSDTLPVGNIAQFKVSNPHTGACVTDGGEMRCLTISVTANGQIRMCDPAVPAGDMRAC